MLKWHWKQEEEEEKKINPLYLIHNSVFRFLILAKFFFLHFFVYMLHVLDWGLLILSRWFFHFIILSSVFVIYCNAHVNCKLQIVI